MNAMDLQLSVFQKTGASTQVTRPIGGSSPVQRPSVDGGRTPSFSNVLAALRSRNEAPRTAPASSRLRAMEANVAGRTNAAVPIVSRSNTPADHTAAVSDNTASSSDSEIGSNGLDISTKEARKILRDALNSDDIPTELLTLLTDSNGDISDDLLDLILADDEEESTGDRGLGTGDVSDQLTSVLTDARQAQELLSTQSGRELINAMSERSIASLVTG